MHPTLSQRSWKHKHLNQMLRHLLVGILDMPLTKFNSVFFPMFSDWCARSRPPVFRVFFLGFIMIRSLSLTLPLSGMVWCLKISEAPYFICLGCVFFYPESLGALQGWESRGETFFLLTAFQKMIVSVETL